MAALDYSILITAYNSEHTIARALDSALQQSGASYEIIVYCDGCTDGTEDIVRRYEREHPGVVKCLVGAVNGGCLHARNKLLEAAAGSHIIWLDSDDELLPCAISDSQPFIEANDPDIFVMTEIWNLPGKGDCMGAMHNMFDGVRTDCLDYCLNVQNPADRWFMHGKVFKAGLLQPVKPELRTLIEDTLFMIRAYGEAKSMMSPYMRPCSRYYYGIGQWSGHRTPTLEKFKYLLGSRLLEFNLNADYLESKGLLAKHFESLYRVCDFHELPREASCIIDTIEKAEAERIMRTVRFSGGRMVADCPPLPQAAE